MERACLCKWWGFLLDLFTSTLALSPEFHGTYRRSLMNMSWDAYPRAQGCDRDRELRVLVLSPSVPVTLELCFLIVSDETELDLRSGILWRLLALVQLEWGTFPENSRLHFPWSPSNSQWEGVISCTDLLSLKPRVFRKSAIVTTCCK